MKQLCQSYISHQEVNLGLGLHSMDLDLVNVTVKGGREITFWLNINASLSSKPEDM